MVGHPSNQSIAAGGRGGFTLVELMVAMAIGLVVAFTAYAGFDAAVETVTRVSAMAKQNRMLRVGFQHALQDIDSWEYYDRPDHQDLRQRRHPFYPMDDFSSDHLAWQRSSFYAGSTQVLYDELGNYARVGYAERDPTTRQRVWSPGNDHHHRTDFLNGSLGIYALLDYLPANAVLHGYDGWASGGYYWSPGGRNWRRRDGDQVAFANPEADPLNRPDRQVATSFARLDKSPDWPRMWWPFRSEAGELKPATRMRVSQTGNVYYLTPNADYGRDPNNDGVNEANAHNHWWMSTRDWRGIHDDHPWNTRQFFRHCAPVIDLVPERPPEWPGVTYFLTRRAAVHQLASGHVMVEDPMSGASLRLRFASLGTTLRGARIQRGLDRYVSHYGTDGTYDPEAGAEAP